MIILDPVINNRSSFLWLNYSMQARNLGTLTTMRVGYDGTGLNPKTTIENVLVRNELTGQCVRFPAGKWLGRGLDDLSTERLLIAGKTKTVGFLMALPCQPVIVLLRNENNICAYFLSWLVLFNLFL